jgi:hypothetical protein
MFKSKSRSLLLKFSEIYIRGLNVERDPILLEKKDAKENESYGSR